MLPFARPLAALAACSLALPGAGQSQVLYFEDFETGGIDWTATGTPQVLWHVSEDGECGAVTRMAVYNRFPAACDYRIGGSSSGQFLSPVFTIDGPHSIVVQLDYRQETDEGSPCVEIVNEADGKCDTIIGCTCCSDPFNSSVVTQASGALPNLNYWRRKKVRLRFSFKADSDGNLGFGCMVDNIRVVASGPPEVLFFEDFEGGGTEWTTTTEGPFYAGPPLWHVAGAGECGAATRVGAYNLAPAACDYHTPNLPNAGRLRSPMFTLSGAPPYTIAFESWKDMNAKGDGAILNVVDPVTGISSGGASFPNSATAQRLSMTISPPGFWDPWSGKQARLEFAVNADPLGNLGRGWMVDNVYVTNAGSLPVERRPTDEQLSTLTLGGWSGYSTLGRTFTRRDLWIDYASPDSAAIPRTIALLGARLKSWR